MKALSTAILVAAALHCAGAPALAQEGAAEGERLFRARCGTCHGIAPGQTRVGPQLSGVMGRTAGSLEGARYSAALQASGIVWDEAALDAYLANPRQAVPGTTMTVGLPNAQQRSQVIDYLRTLGGDKG